MIRPGALRLTWILGSLVALLAGFAVWVFVGWVTPAGDPGGKVIDQLTPTVSALPGYGTTALPWVSQIPNSLDATYAIQEEPFRDSCDGIAGTQGWSKVVVQARFTWSKGLAALVSFMDPRLAEMGWSAVRATIFSYPPGQNWTKSEPQR
ncbi:MAG: hypothetical protein ACYDB2_05310 [Acidimicrobiales bacterium]